jgi:multidrug efflux system membrane fusion protein
LVNARLLVETQPEAITVAASALQQGPNGPYVYVVATDGAVQMRAVAVEQTSEGRDLIASGLKAGETVVIDGQYRLQPGSLVEILPGNHARDDELQSAVQRAIP